MNTFATLNQIDCSDNVDRKGQFSYLSWPFAVAELGKRSPEATWDVKKFPLPEHPHCVAPYMETPVGYFVEVSVTVDGVTKSQVHPVLDHRNKPVPKPDTFQVNTAIQRCLVKAIALHGLGLYIYAGEDLPEAPKPQVGTDPIDWDKVKTAVKFFKEIIDKDDIGEHKRVKGAFARLTSDEKINVSNGLDDKAPGSNKKYSNILKEYLDYKPETLDQEFTATVSE